MQEIVALTPSYVASSFIAEENSQKARDYIMSNKFELLEEADVSTYHRDVGDGLRTTRVFRTMNKITHPVQAMVSISRCTDDIKLRYF